MVNHSPGDWYGVWTLIGLMPQQESTLAGLPSVGHGEPKQPLPVTP